MNEKISLLLCVCCVGNMCQAAGQANFVKEAEDLRNQIKNAKSLIQKARFLKVMAGKAEEWLGQMDESIQEVVSIMTKGMGEEVKDNKEIIIINILRIFGSPDDYFSVTKRVEEIECIEGVKRASVGKLLNSMKECLGLNDKNGEGAPIVELSKRYSVESS
ncbi:MAG: hypothetical protein LBH08_00310 [Puniceicoccales bacterium]|jgi:hypothetical protein|nr:hypothetical protein [Puniceicoccales bacterium]